MIPSLYATGYRQCLSMARRLERRPLALAFLFAWDDAGRGSTAHPTGSLSKIIRHHFRCPQASLSEAERVQGLFDLLRWMRCVEEMAAEAVAVDGLGGTCGARPSPALYALRTPTPNDDVTPGTLVVAHPSELQSVYHRTALLALREVDGGRVRCVDLGRRSGDDVGALATAACASLPSWPHFSAMSLWLGGPHRAEHPTVIHTNHDAAHSMGVRRAAFYVHPLHDVAALPSNVGETFTAENARVVADCHDIPRRGGELSHASFWLRLRSSAKVEPLLKDGDPWGLVMRKSQFPLLGDMRWLSPRQRAEFRDRRNEFSSTSSTVVECLARWSKSRTM